MLDGLNGNDVLDVQVFIKFLEAEGLIEIKDERLSSLANVLDKWSIDKWSNTDYQTEGE